MGLLEVAPFKAADKKRKKDQLYDKHGSFRLNDIEGKKKEKKEIAAKAEAEKVDRLADQESKASAAAVEEAAARVLWDKCASGACQCEGLGLGEGCRQRKLKLCSNCNTLKQRPCGVKACVDAGRTIRCIPIPAAVPTAVPQVTEAGAEQTPPFYSQAHPRWATRHPPPRQRM